MPRFDQDGRLLTGTGSGVVSVNGEVIAHGGVANWLMPGKAIFQNASDDKLYIFDVYTPAKPPMKLPLPNGGANALAAGGGKWIAWLAGTGLYGPSGVIDASGRLAGVSQEQDGRGAASPEGHIAVTDNENRGFKIIGPNGEVTLEVTGTYALSMHVLSGTAAVWVDEHHRPRAVGMPEPDAPAMALFAIRAVRVNGALYVLAGTNDGLIFYPWHDASHGWKYAGDAFYPTHFVRDGSLVSVAFATGAGETPESIRVWNVNVSTDEKIALGAPAPPAPQPQPQPPPQSTEPVPMPEIPDQTATVARVREKYPTPLGASHAACLLEIAREIGQGAGLLRKETGTNILLPDGVRVAQDIIVFPNGDGYDCLGSGETVATPTWGGPVEGSPFPASRYYAVSGEQPVPGTPIPPVPPLPTTGSLDIGPAVRALIAAAVAPLHAEIAALTKAIDERPSQPAPAFPSRIALKSAHGKYVAAEDDGRMTNNRDDIGSWETFDVIPQN